MGLKEQRKLDKKRKARDAKRKALRLSGAALIYDGDKYHTDQWSLYFSKIETAIYDCVIESKQTITGPQIRQAVVRLIEGLRQHVEPSQLANEPPLNFEPGREVEFLMARVRHSWRAIFDELPPISHQDLTGLHRSLLSSIDAQNNRAAGAPGYVDFLLKFIPQLRGLDS